MTPAQLSLQPLVWVQTFSMEVYGEPVPKARPRVVTIHGHARAFTPAKSRKYQERVAKAAKESQEYPDAALDEPLRAEILLVFQKPPSRGRANHMDRKPDIDNVIKNILDGLNDAGVIRNDSRIVELTARKEYGDDPRAEVKLFRLEVGET